MVIANEIRLGRARLIIIGAIAVVDRLDIGGIAVAGLPRPGLDAVAVVEIIIGRGRTEHVVERAGRVDSPNTIVDRDRPRAPPDRQKDWPGSEGAVTIVPGC